VAVGLEVADQVHVSRREVAVEPGAVPDDFTVALARRGRPREVGDLEDGHRDVQERLTRGVDRLVFCGGRVGAHVPVRSLSAAVPVTPISHRESALNFP